VVAMRLVLERIKLIIEPSAVVPFAAILRASFRCVACAFRLYCRPETWTSMRCRRGARGGPLRERQ
jgi:hypothetical protein